MAPSNSSADTHAGGFLNPENAVSGGLRNHFEGTIELARYEQFDFKGKAKPKVSRAGNSFSGVQMAMHLHIVDCDDSPDPVDEYVICGPIEWFVPNDEGDGFEAVTGRAGFGKGEAIMEFMAALVGTGAVKASDLDTDPTFLEGYRFLFKRVAPSWQTEKKNENILVPDKLVAAPGKSGNGRGGSARSAASSGGARGSRASQPADTDETELTSQLVEFTEQAIKEYAEANPKAKQVSADDLATEVYGLVMSKDAKAKTTAEFRKWVADTLKTPDSAATFFEDNAEDNAGRRTWEWNAKKSAVMLD